MNSFFKITLVIFILFVNSLYSKTFNNALEKYDVLTQDEREYLILNPTLEIATVDNRVSDSSSYKNTKLVGFYIDLLNKINKNLNTKIRVKTFNSWTEAYTNAKNNKVAGVFGLSWSKQREKIFLYSTSYSYTPYNIVVRKDEKNISTVKDFSKYIAATLKHSIANMAIKRVSPNTKTIQFNTNQEIFKAIRDKRADVSLHVKVSNEDKEKYNLKIVNTIYTREGNLHIGINKSRAIFHSIINKGINSLSKQDMQSLKNKWSDEDVSKSIFTKEELNYIKKSAVLKVGVHNWGQVVFIKNKKYIGGIVGDIFNRIEEISGLKFDAHFGTWTEILTKFKNKELDILPDLYYSKQREKFGQFSDSYLKVKEFVYVRQDNNSITSFKDLNNKKVAIVKSYITIKLLKNKIPSINIIETKSLEDSISKLLTGEVDAIFESQIAIEEVLRELLITNIKAIGQTEIPSNTVHVLSKKDDLLLQSILQKSIYSIPKKEKNEIISKWISAPNIKQNVNVAFGKGREPYAFNNTYLKGIEHDLVKYILDMSNISIKRKSYFTLSESEKILSKDKTIDMAVTVKQKNDNFYYSSNFINFENTVITRVSDNIFINKVEDLKSKRIISFLNAYKYLGPTYNNLFNLDNRDKNYKEYASQEKQVIEFLDKKTDIIIVDKNIFKWFLKKLSSTSLSEYKFDFIFPNKNSFKVGFRDIQLRDLFNKNLESIKQTGKYQEIINDYISSDIEAKVKVDSLISALVSKYIFEENFQSLKEITDIFVDLSYIKKIEIFNNQDVEIYESSDKTYNKFTKQYSFYNIENVPRKVGFIKVYFNEDKLKIASRDMTLIPKINLFLELNSYSFIQKIYNNFDYIGQKLKLTKKEIKYIEENPTITFSTLNWPPISIVEKGKMIGILDDYFKIIEEKTGLSFRFNESSSWMQIKEKFKKNEVDLIPSMGTLNEKDNDFLTSKEVSHFHFAIVTKQDGVFADEINDLQDKIIALPKGFPNYNFIKYNYPRIKIAETETMKEALSLVSQGRAYAFVAFSEVSIYNIKKYFPKLKVVGITEDKFIQKFLIQKEFPELLSIIDKVLLTISHKQKQDIREKWIGEKINTAIDYTILYQVVVAFLLILIIVLYFMRELSKNKNDMETINLKLKDIVDTLVKTKEDLEEQKNIFETLFKDSADGVALIKDGSFIDCNNSLLKMLGYKTKKEFLKLKSNQLSPKIQPDGHNSQEKILLLFGECVIYGSNRFEWVLLKSSGEEFWVEIVLTNIVTQKENLIHVVWRNIGAKKRLESDIENRSKDLELSNDELEDSNKELQSVIKNLKQTQEQLIASEKMASLGGLVAGVAHEINTPVGIGLTGISHLEDSTKEIAKRYKDEIMSQEEFEEYLKTSEELSKLIHVNLNKAASLVKSFKQVAVDQSSEEKREFNLKKYMNEILLSINSVTKKTNIKIEVNCEKDIKINSYPGAYSQVITNLIMNSIIHGFKHKEIGEIKINIEKKENKIEMIYKDNGKGIKKENINKIFDPFFTTNRENGGSGLGLNIIYNIITTSLSGTISCKSEENDGVEFIIILNI